MKGIRNEDPKERERERERERETMDDIDVYDQ